MRFWPTEGEHINFKELEALEKVLKEKSRLLKGRTLIWFTDKITARAMVENQGSQNIAQSLWRLSKRVLDFALAKDIRLVPRHVPGRSNLLADQLSRPGEKRMSWQVALTKLVKKVGPCNHEPFGVCEGTPEILKKQD